MICTFAYVTTQPPVARPDVVVTLTADEALVLRRVITSNSVASLVREMYERLSTLDNPRPAMPKDQAQDLLFDLSSALRGAEA